MPAWADLNAIKAIYKKASELSKSNGIKWHVDHEIPLKHPLVCGLHNEFNLRVIPARENQSKGNKLLERKHHGRDSYEASQTEAETSL